MSIPPPMAYAPRPFFKRPAVRAAAAVIGALVLWQWFGHRGGSGSGNDQAVHIKVATATSQSLPVTINAVGNVVTYETVAVRARLDSQVTAVHFKDGDEVKKGDVLFELDDKALRAQAALLSANIARDRAQLENARHQASRAETLAAKGFATKATQDDMTAAVAVASANVSSSQAALDNVNVQLGYTRITAPISGRTGTINVTLGNNVKANDTQPLVTINQLKPIRVQAALPQQYFDMLRAAIQAGPVKVSVSRQGETAHIAEGTLDYIDNAIDASTGTFVTRAGFANEDESLLPGMFVSVTLALDNPEAMITVPEVAIQHGQTGDYVFVIENDKALKRDVKVNRLQNGIAVMAQGLEAGTVVAIDGILGLKDGMPVKITQDAPAAAPSSPAPLPPPPAMR